MANVTGMVMKKKAYKILVGIFEGKRLVQTSGCIFEVDINTLAASYLKKQGPNNSWSTLVDLTFQSRALRSALSA